MSQLSCLYCCSLAFFQRYCLVCRLNNGSFNHKTMKTLLIILIKQFESHFTCLQCYEFESNVMTALSMLNLAALGKPSFGGGALRTWAGKGDGLKEYNKIISLPHPCSTQIWTILL